LTAILLTRDATEDFLLTRINTFKALEDSRLRLNILILPRVDNLDLASSTRPMLSARLLDTSPSAERAVFMLKLLALAEDPYQYALMRLRGKIILEEFSLAALAILIIVFNSPDIMDMDQAELTGSFEIHGELTGDRAVTSGFKSDLICALLEMKLPSHQ